MKLLAIALCLLSLAAAASEKKGGSSSRKQGESLFSGRRPLVGRIRGHGSDLPPEVVVCAHCHTQVTPDSGAPAAPIITRAFLTEQRERRGGPPSAYDLTSFCKLLRTGVDPAYVIIDRVMPTYDVSDAACASLWQYLSQ